MPDVKKYNLLELSEKYSIVETLRCGFLYRMFRETVVSVTQSTRLRPSRSDCALSADGCHGFTDVTADVADGVDGCERLRLVTRFPVLCRRARARKETVACSVFRDFAGGRLLAGGQALRQRRVTENYQVIGDACGDDLVLDGAGQEAVQQLVGFGVPGCHEVVDVQQTEVADADEADFPCSRSRSRAAMDSAMATVRLGQWIW